MIRPCFQWGGVYGNPPLCVKTFTVQWAHHAEVRWIEMSEGVRAGMVCRERKEEQPRDLLRDGVLSEKRRGTPSGPNLDFLAHGRRSAGDMGSPNSERLLIQVRRGYERSSTNDFPMKPIEQQRRVPVTISPNESLSIIRVDAKKE